MDALAAGGDSVIPYVFLGFVIVAFVAVWILGSRAARKRREELAAWCQGRGLEFSADRYHEMDKRYGGLHCLQHGRSRYAYNIMSGSWNERYTFLGFDYHYVTGSGKNSSTHNISVVVLGVPFELKPLEVRREGFFDKVAGFFGYEDIDFESNTEFSKRFHVKAADPQWAHDVLGPVTMDFLLGAPPFSLQMAGPLVAVWRSGRIKPQGFEETVAVACGVLDRLPEQVVRECLRQGAASSDGGVT